MSSIEKNYLRITDQIRDTLIRVGRPPHSARLLAVSKGQPVEAILELVRLGQMEFGENYVQEWKRKKMEREKNGSEKIHWHFTGRLQTNKVKELVGEITLFHSIDRFKLAQAIDQHSETRAFKSKGLIEVDLAGEEGKGGTPERDLEAFLSQLNLLNHLEITGLMVMPPLSDDPETSRPYFKRLREILFDLNRKSIYRSPLQDLSMGMTNDYLVAIEEGATWVRVGRALFL